MKVLLRSDTFVHYDVGKQEEGFKIPKYQVTSFK